MLSYAAPSGSPASETAAWGHFWKHGGAARCVPNETPVFHVISACWSEFARSIPHGGRVLDLGTGLGYVLKEIARARPDVELVGIDSVPSLAAAEPGLGIQPGIKMEQLPFGTAEFDGVCSQFGFEYSDMRVTVSEMARVLRPGGNVQFLAHHHNGIVVAQSAKRRAALQWVLDQSGILEKAALVTRGYRNLSDLSLATFSAAVVRTRESKLDVVAAEVAAAVRSIIVSGERIWIEQLERPLERLTAQARNELTILTALERVALDVDGIESVLAMIGSAGLNPRPRRTLEICDGVPFAWLVQASKGSHVG